MGDCFSWRRMLVGVVVASVVALFGPSVRGDVDASSTGPLFSPDFDSAHPYPKGLRLVTVYGGYAEQPSGEREQIGFCNVGLNYYFWENWAFGIEGTGMFVNQNGNDAAAGGADLLLRTHLINLDRFSFYGDFSAGVLEADHAVPPGGTDFNFTIRTGVGAVYDISPRVGLMFGLRYMHLSNARQEGPGRNPSLNAIEGYAGVLFRM